MDYKHPELLKGFPLQTITGLTLQILWPLISKPSNHNRQRHYFINPFVLHVRGTAAPFQLLNG